MPDIQAPRLVVGGTYSFLVTIVVAISISITVAVVVVARVPLDDHRMMPPRIPPIHVKIYTRAQHDTGRHSWS